MIICYSVVEPAIWTLRDAASRTTVSLFLFLCRYHPNPQFGNMVYAWRPGCHEHNFCKLYEVNYHIICGEGVRKREGETKW